VRRSLFFARKGVSSILSMAPDPARGRAPQLLFWPAPGALSLTAGHHRRRTPNCPFARDAHRDCGRRDLSDKRLHRVLAASAAARCVTSGEKR